jgi:sporulation protein YlmC with PRC-barrel domain
MKEDTRSRDRQADRVAAGKRHPEEKRRGQNNPNLHALSNLDDYKVASDDPDVRGWTVISGDNENVGKVDELIVDTKRMKVRYLVVDINNKYVADPDNEDFHMLIPVGAARLHEKNNDVIVSNITTDNITHYPPYYGDRITRDQEQSIRRFYEAGGTVPATTATESVSEHETIRDAHTGKIYERQEGSPEDRPSASRSHVDSNSRNRVDVATGTSGDTSASGTGDQGNVKARGTGQISDLPQEDRMKDRSQASSNSIRGDRSTEDRRPDDKTALGSFNHTAPNEVRDRIHTSGISSSRTSNLENKELEQGPSSKSGKGKTPTDISEEERVRIHDTDPNVESPKGSENRGDFNSTSNLNRSTSKGDDLRRGSNVGNQENRERTPGIQDRSRMSSPEFTERTSTPGDQRHPDKYPEGSRPARKEDITHSSEELPDDRYDPENDEFYTHDHFDEDRFYGNRRKREK